MASPQVIEEAELALREADPLCVMANGHVNESKQFMEQAIVLWARLQFLNDALADQLQNMGNLYVLLRTSIDQADNNCTRTIKELKTAQATLLDELNQLGKVKIDVAFANHGATLHSFVHIDGILALQMQTDDLVAKLKQGVRDLVSLPDKLQKELLAVRKHQPSMQRFTTGNLRNLVTDIASIADKMGPHVHEMAQWLDSLTRHYDFCMETYELNEDEVQEALAVVEADRLQLEPALKVLHESSNQLVQLHSRAQNYLASLQGAYDEENAFFDRLEAFTLHTLRKYCDKVNNRYTECTTLFNEADAHVAELDGLAGYYRLFREAYRAMVGENTRRKRAQTQLARQIAQYNTQLAASHAEEAAARASFVEAWGEFLPKDLWSRLDAEPPAYSIPYEPEEGLSDDS